MIEDLPLQVTAFLILFARVGSVLMLLPVFSEDAVPAQIRLFAGLGMTLGLWSFLSPRILPIADVTDAVLAGILVVELLIGIGLGLIMRMMYQAISIAGSLISLQIGLTSAMVFDPGQSGQAPILSKFVGVAAAVVCFAMAVHHLWLGALIKSYGLFPVGVLPNTHDFAQLAVRVAGNALALGVSLAAPLLVYGIVFNTVLGLVARVAPALQVFFIAQPLNLLLGVTITAATFGAMLIAFANSIATWMNMGWS
ncbi:flagellar biosynthetic protein FliR [Sphingomonas sp. BE123]|jgi:flagellar biosynthetic protein FliR|uniref:flagellar biosynthetic protein FliR n=1 Tax=unclassified Sphingomonas TaxID=196159 RepID=UPI00285A52D8|nr:flagellar biosynthetic protein FliR [Sphingomonas sp. BE123]MDR6853468.1 flagellar biosynthetic protein FliR [Sphingomonas sp. BE123]